MTETKLKLDELIAYRDRAIASKSLSRKLGIALPFVVYALDAGESISNEQSSLTRIFQVIDGELTVVFVDHTTKVAAGELFIVPHDTLHELRAETRCQIIQMESR